MGHGGAVVAKRPTYDRSNNELPTVAEALAFATLSRGDPVVVAGASGLDRRVRWVHMSELLSIADLLHGGELLLTMGIVFPDDDAELTAYVERLADAGAAALVVGLGPRYPERLPPALVVAAEQHGLPLIALRRTIAFIDVTEEVHAALIDLQVRDLQASESIHVMFSALAVQGGRPEIVLKQVAQLSGFAVVLENRSREMLAFDPGDRESGDVLAEWRQYNQRPHRAMRTFYDPLSGWLQTTVGARGNDWGRLVLMAPSAGARELDAAIDPTVSVARSLIMLVEQAASTLAIGRLVDRESELLDLTTHSSVLGRLLGGDHDETELEHQAAALGVSLKRMRLAAFAIRDRRHSQLDPRERQRTLRALTSAISDLAREHGLIAMVGAVDDFTIGVLAALPRSSSEIEEAGRLASRLREGGMPVLIASAGSHRGIAPARDALLEAIEIVSTAAGIAVGTDVVTSADLGLRGLVYMLRDDPRVATFAQRTVGALISYDAAHNTNLVALLRHFLDAGRNKSVAARHAYVSRPWMHERLRLIGEILELELEREENCVNLQVALLVLDAQSAQAHVQASSAASL